MPSSPRARAVLPRAFYARDVLEVARECIGKRLVAVSPEGTVIGRIVEAEAYRGPEDRAAHSFGGRRTERTEAMFGPAGHAYVFFVYGMHWQMNLVTGESGQPHAVLLRAVEPLAGVPLMADRRKMDASQAELARTAKSRELTNGPGKLCQAFGIGRQHYAVDLTKRGALYLEDGPAPRRIGRSPRVGVDYAGEWALRPYRFFDVESPYVSKVRTSKASAVPRRGAA